MFSTTIDQQELEAVRAIVVAADPSETDPDHGVALTIQDGRRQWTAWSDTVLASTIPFGTADLMAGSVLVSRRAVEFATALGEDADGVELIVDGGVTIVSDGLMTLTFSQPSPRTVPPAAEAVTSGAPGVLIGAGALSYLFRMGQVLPAGVDLDVAGAPPFEVVVEDGAITAFVDWRPAGAAATELRCGAETYGAGTTWLNPSRMSHVVSCIDPETPVTLILSPDQPWVTVASDWFTAYVGIENVGGHHESGQLELPFVDTISCQGGLRPDPLPGASVVDVLAFTMDPDVETRIRAAASRWNWDVRVQVALAGDADERVVLALLDHVDPCVEACEVIAGGPHIGARRVLAKRRLTTQLLEALADDADAETAAFAQLGLAGYVEVTG